MDELDKIKSSYASGELEPILKQLEVFITCHREQILRFKVQEEMHWKKSLDLATAVKLFILHVRSIDSRAEMLDQITEINKTIGGGFADLQEQNDSCFAWVQKNAPIWRAFRVLAIIYVFDQNWEKLIAGFNSERNLMPNYHSSKF